MYRTATSAAARTASSPTASRLTSLQTRRAFSRATLRPRIQQQSRYQNKSGSRRWQSSTAEGGSTTQQQSLFERLWNSPVGVKTVHFWAPVMKWALVVAGISDFARPVEKLSLTQNAALTATGMIWTRWCFIIKPRNILLAAVNFFLGTVGAIQVTRILLWQQSQKSGGLQGAVEDGKEKLKESGEKVKGKVEEVAEKAK